MKILLSATPNPHALESLYRQYISRHETVYEFSEARSHSRSLVVRMIGRVTKPLAEVQSNARLLRQVRMQKPDVVWIFKGSTLWPSTIRKVKALGPLTVNYNADHPFDHYSRGSGNRNIARAAEFYDLHLTYSKTIRDQLIDRGLTAVVIPFGHEVGDQLYADLQDIPEELSIGFIGNPDEKRANAIQYLVNEGLPVEVYGNRWDGFLNQSSNLQIHGPVEGQEMYPNVRKHRVQLNLLRPHNVNSHNMRSFEVPACGGIMLAEDTIEHREFFRDGETAFYFGNLEQLKRKAQFLLALPSREAVEIRIRARDASRNASYQHRAESALSHVGQCLDKQRCKAGSTIPSAG